MLWLFFALLAPLLWAVTNLIDDDLILHRLKKPLVIVGITGLFAGIPALCIILSGHFTFPSWTIFAFGILTGVVSLIAYYPYYRALETTNPESAILFWNLAPVIVTLFAFVFLNERLSLIKYVAIGLIIVSTIVAESSHVEFKPHGNAKALRWMILASVFTATQDILEKKLYNATGPANGIALICIGSFITGLIFLFPAKRRREFIHAFQKNGALLSLNHSLDIGAVICSNIAIAFGTVSIVAALQGIQALFVIGLAWVATRLFTKKQFRLAKAPPFSRMILAVLLAIVGLWVIS